MALLLLLLALLLALALVPVLPVLGRRSFQNRLGVVGRPCCVCWMDVWVGSWEHRHQLWVLMMSLKSCQEHTWPFPTNHD